MFWGDVDLLDTDPCGAGRRVEPGPTVRALADALADALAGAQTGQVSRRATAPTPVTVGGHRGLYVEATVPRHLTECDPGGFTVFTVDQSDQFWYSAGPGSVLRFWIVDVDGQRVVITVKVVPDHTVHAADLVHMAETAGFVEYEG